MKQLILWEALAILLFFCCPPTSSLQKTGGKSQKQQKLWADSKIVPCISVTKVLKEVLLFLVVSSTLKPTSQNSFALQNQWKLPKINPSPHLALWVSFSAYSTPLFQGGLKNLSAARASQASGEPFLAGLQNKWWDLARPCLGIASLWCGWLAQPQS